MPRRERLYAFCVSAIPSPPSAAFSPDGRRIATSADEVTKIWEATAGAPPLQVLNDTNLVESVASSPDGARVVTTHFDGTAFNWGAASLRCQALIDRARQVLPRHSPWNYAHYAQRKNVLAPVSMWRSPLSYAP